MGILEWLFGTKKEENKRPYQTAPEEWGQPGTVKYYYESFLHNLLMRNEHYFYDKDDKGRDITHYYSDCKEIYKKRYGYVDEYVRPAGAIDLNNFVEPDESNFDYDVEWQRKLNFLKLSMRDYFIDDHEIVSGVLGDKSIKSKLSYDTISHLRKINNLFNYLLREDKELIKSLELDD